jgi:hypothetical protein
MALDLDCPNCRTDEHVVLIEAMTGTQRKLRCDKCGYESLRGEPAPMPKIGAGPRSPSSQRSRAAWFSPADPGAA